jgi:hypothetical protein
MSMSKMKSLTFFTERIYCLAIAAYRMQMNARVENEPVLFSSLD